MNRAQYALRIKALSDRIFGNLAVPKDTPNYRVIQRLAQKPITQYPQYSMDYYPRHQDHDHLFKTLRYYGLYRDEHRDFAEEIERLKKLRGKTNRQRRQPADPTFKD